MYQDLFQRLGLAKNEARIYEMLLREGESPVGEIATKSKVHRRNVYDSLNRLIERGLVFELIDSRENRYQAVAPVKLKELLKEKEEELLKVMPSLDALYQSIPHTDEVYVYRGVEGMKNYMRDILRLEQDDFVIAGKGQFADPRIKSFLEQFKREAKKKGIQFHILFDSEVEENNHEILRHLGDDYRILNPAFSTPISIDIFADRVVVAKNITLGHFDENMSFTVIVNQLVADSFRVWFKLMWDASSGGRS